VPKPADPDAGGTLFVVATPLGNLSDTTFRAVEVLKAVDAIAAEDTRRTRKLLSHFEIKTRLVPYHEHNEERAARRIVERLKRGDDVALVSDAGTPLVADPGYTLVTRAIGEGIEVVPIPGPSAVAAALSVAGLPPLPFHFAGFLPRRSAARKKKLEELSGLRATLAFYESPHRIADSLADMAEVFGDREAVVLRELTKIHEEIIRGRLPDLAEAAGGRRWKGEIVVLVAGSARRKSRPGPERGGGPAGA
jgi:16S rRNA (cytidine1402-2'-O)-methyltransferase